ncbi:hypothetical protein LIER_31111 [Lithospermum erythrorhizon]|uniref:Uncharacterized protein n=1 Tax=Lithospermum erythrorhizon TaxID=34254 RepID=A0AAV3RTJ5_LITER
MTSRIKRAASKPRYPLKQGRGRKSGNNEVLHCYVLHANDLQDLITWREMEFQWWTPFFTSKLPVYEPLVIWFNRHVQFHFDECDGEVENDELFIMCGKRKFKFGFSEFETDFGLKHEGFNDYYLREFPADIPVGGYPELNLLLNHDRTLP